MDPVDLILEEQNAAETGPDMKPRPEVHPAFHAGNHLTDALEAAQSAYGNSIVADFLADTLDDRSSPHSLDRMPELKTLRTAIQNFRRCVSVEGYFARLRTRLNRLRAEIKAP